jgi:S-adenosylmethionine hydrolase
LSRPVVALLTDFGTRDPFVGVMKAVIVSRCPEATILDVTHDIEPQAVAEAAFWLSRSFRWFPKRTVFVAVVDPGVGTERYPVVATAHDRVFVGPDNGILSACLDGDPGAATHVIDVARLGLGVPSRTFHGRDVFAKVAAELCAGRLEPALVGPSLAVPAPSCLPLAARRGKEISGEVVTVDRFGNLITNIELDASHGESTVQLNDLVLALLGTYADVPVGAYVALVNAFGVVEIGKRDGNAAAALGARRGQAVTLRTEPRS